MTDTTPARAVVRDGTLYECVGGTYSAGGQYRGPCYGVVPGPDCPYCARGPAPKVADQEARS